MLSCVIVASNPSLIGWWSSEQIWKDYLLYIWL